MSASTAIRILGGTSFLLLSCISIVLNGILIVILLQGRQQFSRISFFVIVWQMIIADLMEHFTQIFIAVPITYSGSPIYDHDSYLFNAISVFETVAYNATLYFNFIMTMNRLTVFFFPTINEFVFGHPNNRITVVSGWVFVLIIVTVLNLIGCRKNFSSTGFYFFHDCRPDITGAAHIFRMSITVYNGTYLPLLMLILYIFVLGSIKLEQMKLARNISATRPHGNLDVNADRINSRREISFLIQSFLICAVQAAENIYFQASPNIATLAYSEEWENILNFIGNYLVLMNNSIGPIILFCFNSQIRNRLKELLGYVKTDSKNKMFVSMNTVTKNG
ncbi:serpentine type 7TM GPCR chemoreceptor srx domain-containing protein [Ditylenchus destructor]|nr:serpentine type 7TM GPCR chemoreceptor srx domain-containing protein [Ditylenchus destructor]